MFEWTIGNANSAIVTIYEGNITLNNVASSYFQDVAYCMIGINRADHKVAIKPIHKKDLDLNLVEPINLHKIFNGKGYSRISNKAVIAEMSDICGRRLDGDKFFAEYNARDKMIVFDLVDGKKEGV